MRRVMMSVSLALLFVCSTAAYAHAPFGYDPNCEYQCGFKEGICEGSCLNRLNDGRISAEDYPKCMSECKSRGDACELDCRWKD